MNQQQINLIRDAAVLLETKSLEMAHDLMAIAHENRPQGQFIKKKLGEYKEQLKPLKKVKELFESGELAMIPAGFRCFTKMEIFKKLGLKQASLPFDNGFFSPYSIASILRNKNIQINFPEENNNTHAVCIKTENHTYENLGQGIKFEKSTYDEINLLAVDKKQKDINRYLDSTFGFYTLDIKNKFVLAHYNWHRFHDEEKSKGVYNVGVNISNINEMLNARIERMFEMCRKAKYVVFVFCNLQNYKYMAIDDDLYNLDDLEFLSETAKDVFGGKCLTTKLSEISTADKLLRKIGIDTL